MLYDTWNLNTFKQPLVSSNVKQSLNKLQDVILWLGYHILEKHSKQLFKINLKVLYKFAKQSVTMSIGCIFKCIIQSW